MILSLAYGAAEDKDAPQIWGEAGRVPSLRLRHNLHIDHAAHILFSDPRKSPCPLRLRLILSDPGTEMASLRGYLWISAPHLRLHGHHPPGPSDQYHDRLSPGHLSGRAGQSPVQGGTQAGHRAAGWRSLHSLRLFGGDHTGLLPAGQL